mmetsp:Transcript_44990/g.75648  ORF Transcript_44990/g.75648 Transcript_44990/m.75648 type:complete len:200 (-) Transcript_44990:1220-1819(-)
MGSGNGREQMMHHLQTQASGHPASQIASPVRAGDDLLRRPVLSAGPVGRLLLGVGVVRHGEEDGQDQPPCHTVGDCPGDGHRQRPVQVPWQPQQQPQVGHLQQHDDGALRRPGPVHCRPFRAAVEQRREVAEEEDQVHAAERGKHVQMLVLVVPFGLHAVVQAQHRVRTVHVLVHVMIVAVDVVADVVVVLPAQSTATD